MRGRASSRVRRGHVVVALLWCCVRRIVVCGDGRVSSCAVVVPWLLLGRGDVAVAVIMCLVVVECWVVGRKEVACGGLTMMTTTIPIVIIVVIG